MFNPLDLPGPQFLLFFGALSLVILVTTYVVNRRSESHPITQQMELHLAQDLYALAYLNGGKEHLINVTVFSLLDRQLLKIEGDTLRTDNGMISVDIARRPIEKAILQCCMLPTRMCDLPSNDNLMLAIERFAGSLQEKGVMPDAGVRARRYLMLTMGAMALLGTSFSKIHVALQRGHHNIGFLIIMTGFAIVLLVIQTTKKRTATGDKMLKHTIQMFDSLKTRGSSLQMGNGSTELATLAAVYGFSELPYSVQASLEPVHVGRYARASGGSSCSSGGSSCGGSSCGGSGCGGGGCGGCGG